MSIKQGSEYCSFSLVFGSSLVCFGKKTPEQSSGCRNGDMINSGYFRKKGT